MTRMERQEVGTDKGACETVKKKQEGKRGKTAENGGNRARRMKATREGVERMRKKNEIAKCTRNFGKMFS